MASQCCFGEKGFAAFLTFKGMAMDLLHVGSGGNIVIFQVINEREAVPLLLLPHCDTISPILSAFLFQSGNQSAFEGCLEIFLSFLTDQ